MFLVLSLELGIDETKGLVIVHNRYILNPYPLFPITLPPSFSSRFAYLLVFRRVNSDGWDFRSFPKKLDYSRFYLCLTQHLFGNINQFFLKLWGLWATMGNACQSKMVMTNSETAPKGGWMLTLENSLFR